MALPYQPRFLYRRRKNSPIPSAYGEYIKPSPGFDGFGGPSYTLGSLSNRPGSDWSTPRYVREEPVMFMAGFYQDDDELPPEEGYSVPEAPPTDTTGGGDTQTYLTEEEIKTDFEQSGSGYSWDQFQTDVGNLGQQGLDYYRAHKKEIDTLVASGVSLYNAMNQTSGGTAPIAPPPPAAAPPPIVEPYTPPLSLAQQAYQAIRRSPMLQNLQVLKVKPKTSTTTYLILGAAAVGAYFLLRKK